MLRVQARPSSGDSEPDLDTTGWRVGGGGGEWGVERDAA